MHPIRTMLDATSGFECSMPEGLRIAGEIELPFSNRCEETTSTHLLYHPFIFTGIQGYLSDFVQLLGPVMREPILSCGGHSKYYLTMVSTNQFRF